MEETNSQLFERYVDEFVQSIDTVGQSAANLQHRLDQSSLPQPEMTMEAIEELQTALEELHVAEEELRVQNQELEKARTVAEVERQRYHDLFQFAPDGYFVTDDTGIIREANRTAAAMLNISQEFLLGKPLINFIPLEERPTFRHKLQQMHQDNSLQEWELHVSPRNRPTFDAALTASVVRRRGQLLGWRWLLRDITARKQTEEQIRKIELENLRLQETARLKSHFLAIMSHELRSPMNAIIGFSQLLLRYKEQQFSQNQTNMVERILNNGQHLLALIDDILDFSKIEAGRLSLKLERLNLSELVTATTEEMRSLAEQKNLALQVQIALQDPLVINDGNRVRQILVNLLSNAIKFTDSGSVQVEVWELSADRVVIAVRDSGIGIAEADLEHIFDEFRQLNQTLARRHNGTGLGLAITDRLVRMMQGKITVESRLGQGSVFCIELPRQVE